MDLKEIDSLVTLIERREYKLPKKHKIVKAMQSYLNHLKDEVYSMEVVCQFVILAIRQLGTKFSKTILKALEHYDKEELNG